MDGSVNPPDDGQGGPRPDAAPQVPLTEQQLNDLAVLFSRRLGLNNIRSLVTSILGEAALASVANDIGDLAAFGRAAVQALAAGNRVLDAAAELRQTAQSDSRLAFDLSRILRVAEIDDGAAPNTEALLNKYEPFFNSYDFGQWHARVQRVVCAIVLGNPHNAFRGTGFLVGPDLVLTNHHVVKDILKKEPCANGGCTIKAEQDSEVHCFFDYFVPPKPRMPHNQNRRDLLHVAGAQDWLVHARKHLPTEGMPDFPSKITHEFDYALIRLATPVGAKPVRKGGGIRRGWLSLPETFEIAEEKGKRVIVVQHPGGLEQQFDIGTYHGLDQSGTRVWYSVNTAKGSSGGAALDADGKLYALHNATVCHPGLDAGKEYNQGVRIDLITKDIIANSAIPLMPAEQQGAPLWSLNDDVTSPEPIIGRAKFCDQLLHLASPAAAVRVIVVFGQENSGRHFSIKLLRRMLGGTVSSVAIRPNDLRTLTPRDFLSAVQNELGLTSAEDPIPEERNTEDWPRWLRGDAPRWLAGVLERDAVRNPARYPAWIIVDAVVPDEERLIWKDGLQDLVAALCGAADLNEQRVQIPQLRWLFLGKSAEKFPLAGVPYVLDDLTASSEIDDEFATCVAHAFTDIDRAADVGDPAGWISLSRTYREDLPPSTPKRAYLAGRVARLVINRLANGG